jgi:hypothetical protein
VNSPSVIFSGTTVGLKIVSAHTGAWVRALEENGRFEFEMLSPGYTLRGKAGIIMRSRRLGEVVRGY